MLELHKRHRGCIMLTVSTVINYASDEISNFPTLDHVSTSAQIASCLHNPLGVIDDSRVKLYLAKLCSSDVRALSDAGSKESSDFRVTTAFSQNRSLGVNLSLDDSRHPEKPSPSQR